VLHAQSRFVFTVTAPWPPAGGKLDGAEDAEISHRDWLLGAVTVLIEVLPHPMSVMHNATEKTRSRAETRTIAGSPAASDA
jgi:hypothetical protein